MAMKSVADHFRRMHEPTAAQRMVRQWIRNRQALAAVRAMGQDTPNHRSQDSADLIRNSEAGVVAGLIKANPDQLVCDRLSLADGVNDEGQGNAKCLACRLKNIVERVVIHGGSSLSAEDRRTAGYAAKYLAKVAEA